jgi:FMN phosphatase YigB (HAD superfamily)
MAAAETQIAEIRGAVRCVCFDWGGVILRHCRSWDEACGYVGLPTRTGALDAGLMATRREINTLYTTGKIATDEYFARMAQAMDGLYSEAEIRLVHAGWLKREYEGMDRLILKLNKVPGIETAILSNTCASHWERMKPSAKRVADFPSAGLATHRHASHLLGCLKPGAEIYRKFEAATGYAGASVLFFDDLPENIATARELGWRAELVDYTQETAPQVSAALARHGVLQDSSAHATR